MSSQFWGQVPRDTFSRQCLPVLLCHNAVTWPKGAEATFHFWQPEQQAGTYRPWTLHTVPISVTTYKLKGSPTLCPLDQLLNMSIATPQAGKCHGREARVETRPSYPMEAKASICNCYRSTLSPSIRAAITKHHKRWLGKSMRLPLMALEDGKSKIKVLADSVSGEDPPPRSHLLASPHMVEASSGLF